MKQKRRLSGLAPVIGMVILILDGKTAVAGAQAGMILCLKTVIPALFPFFVLSSLLLRNGSHQTEQSAGFMKRHLWIPAEMSEILIPAFLGGYPVGAQVVTQAYQNGALSRPDAERLLAFCSNAGPAFIFGMLGQMFPKLWMVWALWAIHIVGAVLAALLISGLHTPICIGTFDRANTSGDVLSSSVKTMGIVCGWIVLFRVGISFLDRWVLWLLPGEIRVAVIGFLELSNGCCELSGIQKIPIRFILCSGLLAVGGLCVTMQTVSVTKGLSLRFYFLGKLVQLLTSLILSICVQFRTPVPLLFLFPLFFCLKKGIAIGQFLVYNISNRFPEVPLCCFVKK